MLMYKLLLFLKKTDDDQVINHFKEYTIQFLSDLAGKRIEIAKVDSNLLLEEKYSYFCEISASSKDKWNQMMNTKEGKALNKDMMEFHQFITAIFVDYGS